MNNKCCTKSSHLLKPYKVFQPVKHDCSIKNCQFNTFLNLQTPRPKFVNDDNNGDVYCLFHTPKELQQKMTSSDKEQLKLLLNDYVTMCYSHSIDVDFSDAVLYDFDFPTENRKYGKVIFNKAYFIGYPNFDYLQCEELILIDGVFERGARFKNVQIEHLTFKPKKVKEAIVFETGGYANIDTGLITDKDETYINHVDIFKNHVEGDGKVFFIGCEFVYANFTNGMHNNLVFQNCNLANAFFLNSKVDETEFRNCIFPYNSERSYINDIQGREKYIVWVLPPVLILFVYSFFSDETKFTLSTGLDILDIVYAIFFVFIIWGLLGFIGSILNFYFYIANNLFNRHIETKASINKLFPGDHICTADEYLLYKNLESLNEKNADFYTEKKIIKKSLDALSTLYQQFRKNFENAREVQQAGDFFFSQRYIEILSGKKNLIEMGLLSFHYAVNGFGERFLRPLLWLVITIFTIAFVTTPNTDYIATEATPAFLLQGFDGNYSKPFQINATNSQPTTVIHLSQDSPLFNRQFETNATLSVPQLASENNTSIAIYYAISGVVSFITPESKRWFVNNTEYASKLQLIEGVLSWLFIGAFVLALRNRIRRQ